MKGFKMGMAQAVAKPRNRRDRKKFDPIAAAYQNAKAEALRNGASEKEATAIGNKAQAEFLAKRAKERESRPQQKSKGGAVKKPAMAYGGMANKKQHMYSGGGQVKDNMKGLKKLAEKRPDVVRKMGYNV